MSRGLSTDKGAWRVVQVNERAFIAQELGTLLWFWPKWWTVQHGGWDMTWDAVFETQEAARKEINSIIERRKLLADAKAFPPKVVWP
jgi:hypothetical protein